jgi:hypothetical protein
LVADAITRPQGLTWSGAQRLRSELSARLSGDILPAPGTSLPAVKLLRNALTLDMRDIAQAAGGPRAVAAWTRADEIHTLIADRRRDLARIIGAKGDVAPEAVFGRLAEMARGTVREDFERLMQARRAMGSGAWNEVASNIVERLGRTPTGDFSPAQFVREYGRLTPNGRTALFNTTGRDGLRAALDDIAAISQRFQDTMTRYSNPSGTARSSGVVAGLTGMAMAPLHTLAAGAGGYVLARWLAQPRTAQAVARWMNAYTQAATRPGQATATLLEQAQRQLWAAAEQQGLPPENRDVGPITPPPLAPPSMAPVRPATVRPDMAGNRTAEELLRRGVHPSQAGRVVGNPSLAIAMLRTPSLYAQPETPAEQAVQHAGTVAGLP